MSNVSDMTDQSIAASPDQQAGGSGAFVKAFLPGLIIGLVLGGLAGAFLGGIAADTNGPSAMIERSKAEAANAPTPPPNMTPPAATSQPEMSAPPAAAPKTEPKPEPKADPKPPVPETKPADKPR